MDDRSMDNLIDSILRASSILVCVGAGISVNAGIPDFRSHDAGIYSQIPDPDELFHIENYQCDPIPFYKLCQWLLKEGIDSYRPTFTHNFISTLSKSGKLLRCYSQNVDGLEVKAGLKLNQEVIQCHGNFDSINCSECRRKSRYSSSMWIQEVNTFLSSPTLDPSKISSSLRCEKCSGFLKPSVVMFGEPLSVDFFSQIDHDVNACDLLLIIGTSLQVYPFAAIPGRVHNDIPKFLISKGPLVGPKNVTVIDDDCDKVFTLVSHHL